jgi:spermidine synthase
MPIQPDRNPVFASHLQAVTLERIQSPYQLIEITSHPVYGNQLVIDGDLQISEADLAYNVAMVSPLMTLGDFRHIAILGGGDGGVLNEVLEKTILVDIDGVVVDLSRKYLPKLCGDGFAHPQAEVVISDAFEFVAQARGLDGVIYDLTMEPVREEQKRSDFIAEVVALVAESLRPGGVLSMQCCGEGEGNPELMAESRELFQEIRSEVSRHFTSPVQQQVMIPSYQELWTFLSATKR